MTIENIDDLKRDDVIEAINDHGVSPTKLHGYFVGEKYVQVSVAMFNMELDTAIVKLKHNKRTCELDLVKIYILD